MSWFVWAVTGAWVIALIALELGRPGRYGLRRCPECNHLPGCRCADDYGPDGCDTCRDAERALP